MLWFPKKNEEASVPAVQTDEILTKQEPADITADESLGRKNCLKHLQNLLSSNTKSTILKLYIENFKQLNQIFGYDYCETLLAEIIRYLKDTIHQPLYRYIGVEFIIVLENYTQRQAMTLAEELLERFSHVWKIGNTDCLCTIQIGICSCPGPVDVKGLLKCLDAATTKAGELGPNQTAVYDSTLHASLMRRQAIARYLKTALDKKEIEVRFRPTYHTTAKRFTSAEFYMRIFIQDVGMVGAQEFLPIAEDSGQIRAVEYFALHQAGHFISMLNAQGKDFDFISLPISSVILLQEDFLNEVEHVLKIYQIPAGKLMLEIDEDFLATGSLSVNTMLQELMDLGIKLVLRNFVSGYSSIMSLLDFPIHALKLEHSFICQTETNPKSLFIIKGLIRIAQNLELDVIAEGVETQQQVEALSCFHCPYQQGFYYAPTVTQDTLMQIMGSTLEESRHIIAHEKENLRNLSHR